MYLKKKIANIIIIHDNKNKNLIKIYQKIINNKKNIIKFNKIIKLKKIFLNFLIIIKNFKIIKIKFFLIWKSEHFKKQKKIIKFFIKIIKNFKIKIKKNLGKTKKFKQILKYLK